MQMFLRCYAASVQYLLVYIRIVKPFAAAHHQTNK